MNRVPGFLADRVILIQYHRCSPGDLWIQPGNIIRIHVDTAMASIAIEASGTAWV